MTTLASHQSSQLAQPMIGPVPHALDVAQSTLAARAWAGSPEPSTLSANQPKLECTLLDVIDAITEVAENEGEVLATLAHMLDSGRVKLSDPVERETTRAHIAW